MPPRSNQSNSFAQFKKQETEEGFLSDALRDQVTTLQEKFFGFGREKVDHRPSSNHKNPQLLLHGKNSGDESPVQPAETAPVAKSGGNFKRV
jgi:hypothetical protein